MFDTHAHLDDRAFDDDRDFLLSSLPNLGITHLMNPGCSLETSRAASALSRQYDWIEAAVGSHPDSADEVDDSVIEIYRTLCRENDKIRAIGEIGLDYHYEDVPREIQKRAFRMQMALARELDMPVIVHEREAHADAMAIVEEFPEVTGVFHCFSGSVELAQWLVARGWFIGFTGVITFKNARKSLEVLTAIARDRIVIETDSPYMAPTPYRGTRNDPSKVIKMAEKVAEMLDISTQEAIALTENNGKRLYRLKK